MKPKHVVSALAAFCLTAYAAETANSVIITDPTKIVESTTYDLGDRLLTVQEIAKDALPMPPAPIPPAIRPEPAPNFVARPHREYGFLNLGGSVYRRSGQPARTLINYRPLGTDQSIIFWSSADWSLIVGVSNLPDSNGKIWQLMGMFSHYDLEQRVGSRRIVHFPSIPEFSAGPSTIQIVSGNPTPEQMAPVNLYLAHYDAHLTELQAAYQSRIEEQQRLAAEEKAHPKVPEDIVVQFRVLAPEEIVPTETTPITLNK